MKKQEDFNYFNFLPPYTPEGCEKDPSVTVRMIKGNLFCGGKVYLKSQDRVFMYVKAQVHANPIALFLKVKNCD